MVKVDIIIRNLWPDLHPLHYRHPINYFYSQYLNHASSSRASGF